MACPDLLAIDEPTNHLDGVASRMIREALVSYRGVGLLVSHDRGLLDALCRHVLIVDPPKVSLRAGGYSAAINASEAENQAAMEERRALSREDRRLRREADMRRRHADCAEKPKSLHGVAPRDHDARFKARSARVADGQTSKRLRQLDGRIRQTAKRRDEVCLRRNGPMGVEFHGEPSSRNVLFRLASAEVPLGSDRVLVHGDLLMLPSDRVAVVGPNGSGKTTLVEKVVQALLIPAERLAYVPQEVSMEGSRGLLQQVRMMRPDCRSAVMRCVSRLGSEPERILESGCPSPGETRKLLLAIRLANCAQLIIMDEPTNRMDLPSIECLEDALASYVGGLLLVSHDREFVRRLTTTRREIVRDDPGGRRQRIHTTSASAGSGRVGIEGEEEHR
ncbi:ABC-F family ATP-binding cassette domain-containing protein [Candidatus Bipolaricaulota bacterium]|nr:ABC-F family ATP-binding cassette domain-containing protein [Candidatus Bipolaricaulota bacterium]